MKRARLVLLFMVWLIFLSVHGNHARGGKIFVLLAADTSQAGKIALSTGPDLDFMFGVFYANVPKDQLVFYGFADEHYAAARDEWSSRTIWRGPDIRSDLADMGNKLLKAIDNCPAGSDDTIVFFYSGHGAHDARGHYLLMPDQRTTLARQTIIQRIRKKNPRLAVVITDSCNYLLDRGLLPGPALEPAFEPAIRETISPLFDELFMRSRGLVDINSSSEGEVAAAPIGGGLLVLAMTYLWNKPDFREFESIRGIEIEPRDADHFSVPPVDYAPIIAGASESGEDGLHSSFDPDLPPYGYLWANARRRLSWRAFRAGITDKVDELFHTLHPHGMTFRGKRQYTQTPEFYSLPSRIPGILPPRDGDLPRILSLTRDDVILSINGQPIDDEDECRRAIRDSGRTMEFTVRDSRDGTVWHMQTKLRPFNPRFGTHVADHPGGGALVTGVKPGYPCTRNLVLQKVKDGSRGEWTENQRWSAAKYHPQPGDHIVEVNGQPIQDTSDFYRAVKGSPELMTFRIIGHRTGRSFTMRTRLNPVAARTRLGIGVVDCDSAGVHIQYVRDGSPGSRCQVAQ